MLKLSQDKRGILLLIILGTILIVGTLAIVAVSIIVNQRRFTHHQVSRTRAYYAGLAAMNLANERLRTGAWGTGAYHLCRAGCTSPPDENDADIAYNVTITIAAPDANNRRRIDLYINYTYQE